LVLFYSSKQISFVGRSSVSGATTDGMADRGVARSQTTDHGLLKSRSEFKNTMLLKWSVYRRMRAIYLVFGANW